MSVCADRQTVNVLQGLEVYSFDVAEPATAIQTTRTYWLNATSSTTMQVGRSCSVRFGPETVFVDCFFRDCRTSKRTTRVMLKTRIYETLLASLGLPTTYDVTCLWTSEFSFYRDGSFDGVLAADLPPPSTTSKTSGPRTKLWFSGCRLQGVEPILSHLVAEDLKRPWVDLEVDSE